MDSWVRDCSFKKIELEASGRTFGWVNAVKLFGTEMASRRMSLSTQGENEVEH